MGDIETDQTKPIPEGRLREWGGLEQLTCDTPQTCADIAIMDRLEADCH
jgi:hypothetical protein